MATQIGSVIQADRFEAAEKDLPRRSRWCHVFQTSWNDWILTSESILFGKKEWPEEPLLGLPCFSLARSSAFVLISELRTITKCPRFLRPRIHNQFGGQDPRGVQTLICATTHYGRRFMTGTLSCLSIVRKNWAKNWVWTSLVLTRRYLRFRHTITHVMCALRSRAPGTPQIKNRFSFNYSTTTNVMPFGGLDYEGIRYWDRFNSFWVLFNYCGVMENGLKSNFRAFQVLIKLR
jgi:hypothetical protein